MQQNRLEVLQGAASLGRLDVLERVRVTGACCDQHSCHLTYSCSVKDSTLHHHWARTPVRSMHRPSITAAYTHYMS
jgi:hypothetical protein